MSIQVIPSCLSCSISSTVHTAVAKATHHVHESCCLFNVGGRILFLRRVAHRSRFFRSPHWQTRVNRHRRRRRQAAVAQEASRTNHAPARPHQMPEVFFCASPSAASAPALRLRCRGMFSVWASAPHAPLRGVRVPANGHCACPADMHMAHMSRSWAEVVMERVTRGRVKKVQVLLQRRACCAVRCACRASACVRWVFDACCRKRLLVLRCVTLLRIAAAASSAPRR